jgi:2'-5' RNA ligase
LLAASLVLELKQKNFKTEARDFSAHVTLIRKAREPHALPPLPAVDWPVKEFVLVRSRLSSEGPSYEVVERFALR